MSNITDGLHHRAILIAMKLKSLDRKRACNKYVRLITASRNRSRNSRFNYLMIYSDVVTNSITSVKL